MRRKATHSVPRVPPLLPPRRYESWVEYAVDTVSTREVEMDRIFDDAPFVSREAIRMVIWNEFNALRERAGLVALDPSKRRPP